MNTNTSSSLYDNIVFKYSKWVLLLFVLLLVGLTPYAKKFRLDASSDSLVLENDKSLKYFQDVVSKYSTADFLVITYSPNGDLFSPTVLDDLKALRDKVSGVNNVKSIISILDVPLVQSPPITLSQLVGDPRVLLSPETDIELAKLELRNSELYRDLLVSDDYSTTAVIASLETSPEVLSLYDRRTELRELRANGKLTPEQKKELSAVTLEHQEKAAIFQASQSQTIADVRAVIAEHKDNATLFLGGLPMIVADSVSFIQDDVKVFGTASLLVIIFILIIAFRQLGWVIMPLLTCATSGYIMVCLLGLLNWPISVVSSNFLSLLLIITLSLNIHLIVRYRELAKQKPEATQRELLSKTVRSKFIPCVYTALTTMVAFASLIVSGIRPVIDFGWIMCLGIIVAVVTTFTLFPALSIMMKPRQVQANRDTLSKLVLAGAQSFQKKASLSTMFFSLVTVLALYGIANLTVENRFIDYFKSDTEISKGMRAIDEKLGGTTPLDIIIDAPKSFFETSDAADALVESSGSDSSDDVDDDFDLFEEDSAEQSDDFFEDEFDEFESESSQNTNIAGNSYWFSVDGIDKVKAIQASLEEIPATGKVISLATTMSVFDNLKDAKKMDNIDLGFMYNVLSDENKKTLLAPYISEDGNQLHINIRVFESIKGLDRNMLIADIRQMLIEEHGIDDEQINISGFLVLYNNMLNSLFDSQITTLGTVFFVIFIMFIVLFRSLKLAFITIVPNVFSAAVVLGIMGLFSIPLDLMTITIAAISVGIAVDNSIHLIHRLKDEFTVTNNYSESIYAATQNVGQAMFYTTLVITAGFMIMVFSNFVPTLYFGILTGIAMVTALIANLVMLPMLVSKFKPLS